MTYSASSPLLGQGSASAQDIDAWFASHAAQGASYVGLAPRTPPPAGASIITWAKAANINSDLVAAQIADESAYLQSQIVRDKNNPSGYGAENSDATGTAYDKATTFATLDKGIQATVAHLASYVRGDGPWTKTDPRYQNIKDAGWLGVVHVLSDLDGRWAFPGTGYGANIAALANDLVAHAQGTSGGTMPPVDISNYTPPPIIQQWFPVNGVSYMGDDMDMWGVCVHQTGNTAAGAEAQQNVNYMNSQECISRQASWHTTVGLDVIIETIPQTKQAFHASDGSGPGNTHFKAVEHVVCYPVGSPEYQRVMMNGAWYAAKSLHEAGKPCNTDTLKQHHDFARDGKDCPMQFRDHGEWPTYVAYAQAFYDAANAPPPQPQTPPRPANVGDPNARYFDVTDHWLQFGFKAYWEANGGLPVFGYPITDETDENGMPVQYFERSIFEWHADVSQVLLRRLGAEAAKAAGYSGVGI